MNVNLLVFVLLCFLWCCLHQTNCELPCMKQQKNLAKNGTCPDKPGLLCANLCRMDSYIAGEEECYKQEHCCFRNGTCYLKQLNLTNFTAKTETLNEKKAISKAFHRKATNETDARSFNLGGPSITDIQNLFPGISFCPKFPESCHISYTSPEDIQLPTNIPYCQRIPCRPFNPMLEFQPLECFSTPGCAYDFELSIYRSVLSQGILSGVPMCHLVIRNQAFQKYASQYVRKSGQGWNPLLTDCLINHYQDEILKETKECAAVNVFEELGYQAKRAGWKGISSRDCHLIDGCWKNNVCVYPFPLNNFKVMSSYNMVPQMDLVPYGKPECLPFSKKLTNGEFLNRYHACLASGCYVDVDKITLMKNLFGVTQILPPPIQLQYWAKVLSGEVRPDNWEKSGKNLFKKLLERPNNILGNLPTSIFERFGPSNGNTTPPLQIPLSNNNLLNKGNANSISQYGAFSTLPNKNLNNKDLNYSTFQNLIFPTSNGAAEDNETLQRSFSLFNSLGVSPSSTFIPPFVLPCPYVNVQWPGFPKLLGSFEGCCDRKLCYMSRLNIANARSAIATYISDWTSWGPCSSTCGEGQQHRKRFCIGDIQCKALLEQTQRCTNIQCSSYTQWSAFSTCSATCGGGTKTRNRTCTGTICTEKTSELMPCRTGSCPIIVRGKWSKCSQICGIGVQKQDEICTNGGAYGCPPKRSHQQKCEKFCGQVRYPAKSRCNLTTCYATLKPRCVRRNGKPGHCPTRLMVPRRKKCFKKRCCAFHFPHNRRRCRRARRT